MSPTAFRQQVTQLISEVTRCHELCEAIRSNRRLGSTTEALDRLQAGLRSATTTIQTEFNTLRRVIGSRFDLGDETARNLLNRSIRELQIDIKTKLNDIAYPISSREYPELPGFRDLYRRWQRIEEDVIGTLETLARRLEQSALKSEPKLALKPQPKPAPKTDEVVISLKELDRLLDHMKNSWEERLVAGQILYVNTFDDKKQQWERPSGFIKAAPKAKPVMTPTWDLPPRRPARQNSWDNAQGW